MVGLPGTPTRPLLHHPHVVAYLAGRPMMATKARTMPKVRTTPQRRGPQQGRTGRWWWGTAAVVALAAVGLVWAVAATSRDDPAAGAPVEHFMHVHGLEVPAWTPGMVFLSTHRGLIRIEDGDWSYVSEQPHDFMGFAAHPTEPGLLYSSGHPAPGSGIANPVGFMVSTDGGATWQVRALEGEVDFHAMTVGAGGAVVYGWNGAEAPGLYRSGDNGHTWDVIDAPALYAAGGALSLAAHPDQPDRLWAGTSAGLLASHDRGASWQEALPDVPVTAVAFDPADPDRMLAYAASPGDGLIESRDGGQSWTPVGWQLDNSDDAVGHLAIHPDDPQQLYAGTYREGLYHSADGGSTWRTLARNGTHAG